MGKTILLVDDSALICHVVSQVLRDSGYTVLTAKNGQEGISLAKKHNPSLVIMDVEMPVMNGIDATAKMKSEPDTARIPVVIFTSLGREEDIARAREAGCQGFLSKPICKEALNTEVERVLQNLTKG
jgi:two-component system cell cycle response regulator DivK